jgi:hypothetical protein
MAQVTTQVTSYTGDSYDINPLVPAKRSIADLIDMIDPKDTPLVKFLGIGETGQGGMNKAQQFRIQNWPSTMYSWLEDTLAPLSTALAASVTTTTTAITVDNANYLRPGDLLEVDDELILVTAVSSDSATVTRDYAGTSAASHTTQTVNIVSRAMVEGADSDTDLYTQVVDLYNYTQIFEGQIKVSRSQNKLAKYGMGAEWDYQVQKRFVEQVRLLEKTLFYGRRDAGSSTTPRTMGGFRQYISTNTASLSSAALTQKDLEDKIQSAWEYGGMPDLIVCNGWVKRKISSFYAGAVRTTRTEGTGGVVIDNIETEFGTLGMLMSRWCPSDELYVLSSEYVGILPFDPFFDEPLAKDGDYEKGHIVGEYGFVVKNEKSHAHIIGISTSS